MILDIATGTGRKTKIWKNTKISWDDMIKRCSETHRFPVTFKEFKSLPKLEQAELKASTGGFVGGYLIGGLRTPVSNIKHRQLIALDIDFGKPDTWDQFMLDYDHEMLSYSTSNHTPENPRLRILLPLDRPVSCEEYEAIARRIAEQVCMECFDRTTFQPQRLMYWPSTAKDGVFFHSHQKGDVIVADEILATYEDWTDVSSWPRSDGEDALVHTAMKKQGDPSEKPGLIGAFCRAYDIETAVEKFLPEVYESAGEGRMTFKGGKGNMGAVLYDNGQFLYSHHSTDPAGGYLLNAFDLVRVHKYGLQDVGESGPVNKLPSYKSMISFCQEQPSVMLENAEARIATAEEDFAEGADWKTKLDTFEGGAFKPTAKNYRLIIENDEMLKGKFKFNLLTNTISVLPGLPWSDNTKPRDIRNIDDVQVRSYVEEKYNIYNVGKATDAIDRVAGDNRFHPVQDYLNSVEWDGTPRIESLLCDYMGADDNLYVRTVTRKALVAAVARAFRPGIKFDYILTLVGKQGLGKSTLFRKLGKDWFSESFTTVQGKEACEQLHGVWIIEIAELSGFKKAEIETVKHFVSKTSDRFRVAYGKRVEEFPRQCIFFGTTNESAFLKDYTGNRRYWPVKINSNGTDKMQEMPVEQLWAEAKFYYDQGENIWLDDKSIESLATAAQEHHVEIDDRQGVIADYLEKLLPVNWDNMSRFERRSYMSADEEIQEKGVVQRTQVCVAEIWCEALGHEYKDMTNANTKYIHQIMHNVSGWESTGTLRRFGKGYGTQRAYIKKDSLHGETLRSETSQESEVARR